MKEQRTWLMVICGTTLCWAWSSLLRIFFFAILERKIVNCIGFTIWSQHSCLWPKNASVKYIPIRVANIRFLQFLVAHRSSTCRTLCLYWSWISIALKQSIISSTILGLGIGINIWLTELFLRGPISSPSLLSNSMSMV